MLMIAVFLIQSCIKIDCGEPDSGSNRPVKGKGPVVSEERLFSSFTAVSSQLGADVNIFESDDNYIVISAQENLLPYIKTNVKSSELRISTSNTTIQSDKPITIDVYTSEVKKFTLAGAGNIVSDLPVKTIILSGAGNIYCKGEVENLDVLISGVGNIDLFEMPNNAEPGETPHYFTEHNLINT